MDNVTFLPWVARDEQPTAGASGAITDSADFLTLDVELAHDADLVEPLDSNPEAIFDALLRRLAVADLTVGEVLRWCDQREVSIEQAHAWLDRLHDLGYVDDHRVASFVARKQRERKGAGRAVVALELRRRKVGDDVVADVLSELDDESELQNAINHAVKRATTLTRYDRNTATRRLHGFLLRRGFDSETIREAIRVAFVQHPPCG